MKSVKEEVKSKFDQFAQVNQLDKGTVPVSIDHILRAFQTFAPDVPVTKALLGRILSGKYLKKQHYVFADRTLSQCYYLNKDL